MSRTFAAIVGLASVAVIGGACAPGLSPSQNSAIVPSPAAGTAIDEADVRRILSALADDSMQGRLAGTAGADRAAAYIDREMRSIALTPAGDSGYYQKVALAVTGNSLSVLDSFDALAALPKDQRRIGYNMIGAVRGSDPVLRDQIVVIAAHYDHLGVGMPVNGDSIYNGADDDASGVTAVLEIARSMIAGPRPRRTMVFIATTGEEEGILGTQWYVKHPEFPLSKMVAEMEVEMIGRPDSLAGGPGKGWLTGYDRSTMGDMLKAAGVPIVPDPYPQNAFLRAERQYRICADGNSRAHAVELQPSQRLSSAVGRGQSHRLRARDRSCPGWSYGCKNSFGRCRAHVETGRATPARPLMRATGSSPLSQSQKLITGLWIIAKHTA